MLSDPLLNTHPVTQLFNIEVRKLALWAPCAWHARARGAQEQCDMRWRVDWARPARPKSRRAFWEHRPRRRTKDAEQPINEAQHSAADDLPHPTKKLGRAEAERCKLLEQAAMLWASPDGYSEYLRLEKEADPELWEATSFLFKAQTSSYRRRMVNPRLIERYDAKAEKQIRDTVSVLRRRACIHVIPFSTMARSVSYFNQRVPTRVWRDQQRGLRIGMQLPLPLPLPFGRVSLRVCAALEAVAEVLAAHSRLLRRGAELEHICDLTS
jgi:hypothetical protein